MELFTSAFREKLSGLLFFLKQSNTEFEMVADEIGDQPLRLALNGISVESRSYAGELKNFLEHLGLSSSVEEFPAMENDLWEYYADQQEDGGEVFRICLRNENKLERAYEDVLNEPLPFQSLRDIMLYQLNTLKYTFAKIKMLNTARFVAY